MTAATSRRKRPRAADGLRDTVAVVTGATSGIGRAIALALAPRCALVDVIGRAPAALEAVAEEIRRAGASACRHRVNLGNARELEALAGRLRTELERVDVLVHAAGSISIGDVAESSVESLDDQYRVNVRAAYVLTQRLLPLIKNCRGQIVFVNSTAGHVARGGVAQYAATKHALKAFADSLRDEVNADEVRVLSVYPGRTATRMQAIVHAAEKRPYHPERLLQPEDVAAVVLSAIMLPRTAEVTDVSIRPFAKP